MARITHALRAAVLFRHGLDEYMMEKEPSAGLSAVRVLRSTLLFPPNPTAEPHVTTVKRGKPSSHPTPPLSPSLIHEERRGVHGAGWPGNTEKVRKQKGSNLRVRSHLLSRQAP